MRRVLGVAVCVITVAACGHGASAPGAATVAVFAASSLAGVFEKASDAVSPSLRVEFNFAGTPTLLHQMREGAAADVFASADEANMSKAIAAGLATSSRPFAENLLQVVVPAGNPANISGLADLSRGGVKVALAAPTVPVGAYARAALAKAGVAVTPVTEEENVKAVVAKVSAGEVDAGIVYATDVKAAGASVTGVHIPRQHNVIARYPIAVLNAARNPAGAQRFVDFLLSPAGQGLLREAGFSIA